MKSVWCLFVLLLVAASSHAQNSYVILRDSLDGNAKMLKGIIDKNDITSDTSFVKWYNESRRIYPHPDTVAVNALEKNKDKISFIIFGGTWCEDTQFILPKFFKIQEASGFSQDRITLFAVDRNKKTIGNIVQAMNITNVPTIIVLKNGKELGRVVEYGKTGKWDNELAAIINQ